MQKQLLILALALTIAVSLNSQTPDSTKSSNEISFNNHVIRVYKTSSSGYLYDIFFKTSLVIHQNDNPFTGGSGGLKTREDALKTAKWQIIHLYPTNRQPAENLKKVPIEVARQLNISVN